MKPQSLNRIAELRLARRMSQLDLAEAVGAHKITVSKLERGEMKLTQDWMDRLAKALKVTAPELLSDYSLIRTVYINGRVDNSMVFLKPGDALPDLQEQALELKIDYGIKDPSVSLFFIVETEIFAPVIREGDIVRFSSVVDLEYKLDEPAFLGRLCIVEMEHPHQMLIGILERGAIPRTFDIRHPAGGSQRGIRPTGLYMLNLVLGLPSVQVDIDGVPL